MNKTTMNITFFFIDKLTLIVTERNSQNEIFVAFLFLFSFAFADANNEFIIFDIQGITSL